jgi:hypothetical protein
MTLDNFEGSITALYHRQPFRPFLVELNTGERFEVDFPLALSVRNGLATFRKPGGTLVLFDHTTVNQIIDEPAGRRRSKGNGKKTD